MRLPNIHTRFRKNLVSCVSLAMIALFVLIGIVTQQSSVSKRSTVSMFEKSKKAPSENDFLLFEEDNELSDENETGSEWSKDFSFCPLAAISPETQAVLGNTNPGIVSESHSSLLLHTPLFLRIRSLRL